MSLNLYITASVLEKLQEKHDVTRHEIEACFYNRIKGLLTDIREKHQTRPPTMWFFIAETDEGRLLKIVFIESSNMTYEIKTAYEPNNEEVKIYEKYA